MVEKTKLDIVLFKMAVEEAAKIARSLALDRGHMLLVAVIGSGKKTLCQLASALA